MHMTLEDFVNLKAHDDYHLFFEGDTPAVVSLTAEEFNNWMQKIKEIVMKRREENHD